MPARTSALSPIRRLLEPLLEEQRQRWLRGERPLVETIVEGRPELVADASSLEDLIAHEIDLRQRRGERPSRDEYLRRFPAIAPSVSKLFDVLEALGDSRSAAVDHTDVGDDSRCLPPADPPANWCPYGFEILGEIDRGGMGIVYRARQVRLKREVAVKRIVPEKLDNVYRKWFRAEAEAIGRLHHPHIVQVFDHAEHAGEPYLVLELVDGGSLARLLRERGPLTSRAAATLLEPVARALHYAHECGIIHRDLKPGNVLLAGDLTVASATTLVPKVTDFGLAKSTEAIEERRAAETGTTAEVGTAAGSISRQGWIGTLPYMAPEQVNRSLGPITPAVDVYALGVVLFQMLTGREPFSAENPIDVALRICTEPAPAARSLRADIDADLEAICLRCLAKEPARRYASAVALADDLRRFLAGLPVAARPLSLAERFRRWVGRRPALASLLGMSVVAALTLVAWLVAQAYAGRLENALDDARDQREAAEHARGETTRLQDRVRYAVSINLAQQALEADQVERAREILADLIPSPEGADLRTFEWHLLWAGVEKRPGLRLRGHKEGIVFAQFLAARNAIVSVSSDGTARVWDRSGSTERLLPFCERSSLLAAAVSRKESILVTVAPNSTRSGIDGKVWDLTTGKLLAELQDIPTDAIAVALTEDGRQAATTHVSGEVLFWDAKTGRPQGKLNTGHIGILCLAFSPRGDRLATGGMNDRKVKVWSVPGRQLLFESPPQIGFVQAVGFSSDGSKVAAGGGGLDGKGLATLWHVDTGRHLHDLANHANTVLGVAFSPDDRSVATGCGDSAVRLFDVKTGREQGVLRGHSGPIVTVNFSPDGSRLVCGGIDRIVWIWDLAAVPNGLPARAIMPVPAGKQPMQARGFFWSLAFSPDGVSLAAASGDQFKIDDAGALSVWDAESGRVRQYPRPGGQLRSVAFSPDGTWLASGGVNISGEAPAIQLRNVTRGEDRSLEKAEKLDACLAVTFSPDSQMLAACADGRVLLWNPGTGKLETEFDLAPAIGGTLSFTPDGRHLIVAASNGTLQCWDVSLRQRSAVRRVSPFEFQSVAVSPDGSYVATGGSAWDSHIRLWTLPDLAPRDTLKGHLADVWSLAFSPDGKTLASASGDRVVRLWDPLTGQARLTLHGFESPVTSVTFRPDGGALAVGCYGRTYLFDTSMKPAAATVPANTNR